MSFCRLILRLIAAAAVLSPAFAFAQLTEDQVAPSEQPVAATEQEENRTVREAGPPVYLKDKEGKLILVPSLTLEEYERLMQLDRGLPSRTPPRFTFSDAIELTGSVSDGVAELDTKVSIRFTRVESEKNEWVRIPLRLHQAVLASPIVDQDGNEVVTEYQTNGDGYVIWAQVPRQPELELSLKLKLPLLAAGSEKRFALSVPNWTTRIRLGVSSPDAEGRVDEESGCELTKSKSAGGGTTFLVVGSGGTIKFSWQDNREPPPVLEAEGNMLVKLAGRGFDVEAQLRVRSFGAPIDSFTVRLPPGAKLIPREQADVQVSEASTSPPSGVGQLVVVRRLEGKTSNPIDVRLKATAGIAGGTPPSGGMEIAGFQVTGAQIQRGTVDFTLDGEWSVDWKGDINIRRADVPDALRAQQVVARFEYDRQPFSLKAVVGRGVPRINAEPTYIVTVEANQLKLSGSIRYRITGARVSRLRLDMGGWTVDRIGPADLVGDEWVTNGTAIDIPLAPAALAGRGDFELQVEAHRGVVQPPSYFRSARGLGLVAPGLWVISPATGEPWVRHLASGVVAREVLFDLPRPTASGATSGLVIVSPADNIELTPVSSKLHGLAPDLLPANVTLPQRQQAPLIYREDGVGDASQFHGLLKTRRQAITVAVANRVSVDERDVQIEQRCLFQIAHEPATSLSFEVPAALWMANPEALLDGKTVTLRRNDLEEKSDSERSVVTLELPGKRIGECEVLFRQRVPRPASTTENAPRLAVSLVRPVESESTQVTDATLRLTSAATIGVSLLDERLVPIADTSAGVTVGNDLLFRFDDVPVTIAVATVGKQASSRRSTVIQRIWVQSLLTDLERRDRACFRLNTNESRFTFRLPPGADGTRMSVIVDGQLSDRFVVSGAGEVNVDLAESSVRRELTIELWYWFAAQPTSIGRLSLQSPTLAGGSHADRVYWELRLPSNEHLAWSSRNLVDENTWHWHGFSFVRRPNLSQSDLEQWVQASAHEDEAGFNRYLFSSVGVSGPNMIVTMMRSVALLTIAGVVFAVGTLLMYVPVLRHPLILSAAGLLLIAMATSYPAPTQAAAQFVVMGLSLVILARLLKGVLIREPIPRVLSRGSTFIVSDARSSKSGPRRPEIGSGSGATVSAPPLQTTALGNEP